MERRTFDSRSSSMFRNLMNGQNVDGSRLTHKGLSFRKPFGELRGQAEFPEGIILVNAFIAHRIASDGSPLDDAYRMMVLSTPEGNSVKLCNSLVRYVDYSPPHEGYLAQYVRVAVNDSLSARVCDLVMPSQEGQPTLLGGVAMQAEYTYY